MGCECTHLRRGEFLLHISTFALSRTGQEREDDTECYTQIFLEPDGTVRFGATDGPPPVRRGPLADQAGARYQFRRMRGGRPCALYPLVPHSRCRRTLAAYGSAAPRGSR